MSPEKQRIAIAEVCGWTPTPDEWWTQARSGIPSKECPAFPDPPDYLNDLNAMHEAFKSLGRHWEISQVHDGFYCRIQFGPQGKDIVVAGLELCPVMAEAFLRTLNKWEGGDHD